MSGLFTHADVSCLKTVRAHRQKISNKPWVICERMEVRISLS